MKPEIMVELVPQQQDTTYRVDERYLETLRRKIEDSWPKLEEKYRTLEFNDDRIAIWQFAIHVNGETSDMRLVCSSGIHQLNECGLAMLEIASPFDKLLHFDEDKQKQPVKCAFQATFKFNGGNR